MSAAVIVFCLWGALAAWRAGASRLLSFHGRAARLPAQTERAVREAPDDPEAHSGRAFALLNTGNLTAALPEYEAAVALRPQDYFLWLELGRARDTSGDEGGALAALEQAVNLAPDYAQPRWQFGNVLFRAGRLEEAFPVLRRAALSDPAFLPKLIDLAWGSTGGDPSAVQQIIQPEENSWRIALGKFFVKRGRAPEALNQFRLAGGIPETERQTILKDLLSAKFFKEAYQVWAEGAGMDVSGNVGGPVIDGGFEGKVARSNVGFGWHLMPDEQGLRISLDRVNPHSGGQSLRIDFNGEVNTGRPILSQLILVEPNTRYRLRFNLKMEEVVTGGPLFVDVSDPGGLESQTLAQSHPLQQKADGWHEYMIDVTTAQTTGALVISLRRHSCGDGRCPIFGRLWLDEFIIQKVGDV